MLKKKKKHWPNPLYRRKNSEDFMTEYHGNIWIDLAQFACFDLPIRSRSLYFALSPSSNREFAYGVPNAKLILLIRRIYAMIHSYDCANFLLLLKLLRLTVALKLVIKINNAQQK